MINSHDEQHSCHKSLGYVESLKQLRELHSGNFNHCRGNVKSWPGGFRQPPFLQRRSGFRIADEIPKQLKQLSAVVWIFSHQRVEHRMGVSMDRTIVPSAVLLFSVIGFVIFLFQASSVKPPTKNGEQKHHEVYEV